VVLLSYQPNFRVCGLRHVHPWLPSRCIAKISGSHRPKRTLKSPGLLSSTRRLIRSGWVSGSKCSPATLTLYPVASRLYSFAHSSSPSALSSRYRDLAYLRSRAISAYLVMPSPILPARPRPQ
jgi:hypothetical protein